MITMQELLSGTKVDPRPYQERIVSKVLDLFIQKGMRSILIESPTGSGKTVMGLLAAQGMQQIQKYRIGWVAMRRNLLTQTAQEILERELSVKIELISMFEKNPPKNLDLLVVDEAQHDAANSMAHLHNVIKPKCILGLSATPYRADKVKLCFDSVIRDAGISTLIQDGYLSTFHHYTIPSHTPKTVVEFFINDRERWGQSIFYFHTLKQCLEAQKLLQKQRVRCEVVTGSSDRETQLEQFEMGKIDVLINCMVLAEGFDCPSLQTVFCRPSAKGVTIQMCGRVLRKHPDFPIKNIVQCQKTPWPFVRTAAAQVQYVWDKGSWKSLQVNPLIQQVGLNALKAMLKTEVKLPEFVKKRQSSFQRRTRIAL